MISAGEGFIVRHRSGRYFSSDCYYPGFAAGKYDASVPTAVVYRLVDSPFHADLVATERFCGKWLEHPEWVSVADQFEVVPGPGCNCCGASWGAMHSDGEQHRCEKHKDRNPCAIEGCRCTTAAGGRGLRTDQYLCSKHWRPMTTPEERRVYSRIWRQAKARERKFGAEHVWPVREIRRLERVWDRVVAKARQRAAGDVNMDEINKLFGWES